MEPQKKKQRTTWSKEQTEGLLDFYAARANEFQHCRKKKFAYEHLLEDMLSAGLVDSQTTAVHLENKMHTLLRAYKAAVDNNRQTGAAPCIAPFMERMDDLFGSKPIISNVHNVTIGVDVIGESNEETPSCLVSFSPEPLQEISPNPIVTPSSSFVELSMPSCSRTRTTSATTVDSSSCEDLSFVSQTKKRKMTKSSYMEKKLEMRKEEKKAEREERNQRWAEYMKLEKEKEERRRQKAEMLSRYLNKQQQ